MVVSVTSLVCQFFPRSPTEVQGFYASSFQPLVPVWQKKSQNPYLASISIYSANPKYLYSLHKWDAPIDSVLETTYPSLIASNETQGTTNYIIPQQSASLRVGIRDDQGNISYPPTTLFGGLWGNYNGYYEDRQRDEYYNALCQNFVYCSVTIPKMINPEIFSGTDINSRRTFAIFSPNQNKSIPEPSNIIGLTVIGISILLISRKK